MQQAALIVGLSLDSLSRFKNGLPTSCIDVGYRQIANVLLVLAINEVADFVFGVAGQAVVLEQDTVLHRLMSALDLSLSHRTIGRPTNMRDSKVAQPRHQIAAT